MCGIAGIVNLRGQPVPGLARYLSVMGDMIAHRGPDNADQWQSSTGDVGLVHRRLSIIDLSESGNQPMSGVSGDVIVHNGEVYNYRELRDSEAAHWTFKTQSDTETILACYARYGPGCVDHLRGMFAFAIWDGERLFCARDRFGIKPFYYTTIGDLFMFASEAKALVPFLPNIETDAEAFAEYATFQYTIGEATLFHSVKRLLPGHTLTVEGAQVTPKRYWDVVYEIDYDHDAPYFQTRLRELLDDSIEYHLRSDVPVGAYLSGGVDSSLVAALASQHDPANAKAFHGKFTDHPGYDESHYARAAATQAGKEYLEVDIGAGDFLSEIEKVIYQLDYPVAGPGSFPQYMVSRLASEHVKVVLGGQGGDEIFGGYARYLLAYFEQCIGAAIDGTYKDGNFVVTLESIIPNLGVLQEYKPLIRMFWRDGLFGPLDQRYFRLIDRSADGKDEIDWSMLDADRVREAYSGVFNNIRNVRHESYFDSMTHFDFKCLLPALLHVEDRMSMAHGLESRVPMLDHPLIEFLATVPADVKFHGGQMKYLLKQSYSDVIPEEILNRRDKMGFPVPLSEWFGGELRDFVNDLFRSSAAQHRPFINAKAILAGLDGTEKFSRKLWGLISLELWHRAYHDQASKFTGLLDHAA